MVPNAAPERILVDFEKAAMNAFALCFPTASISGCYFHLCQSFQRKITTSGLKSEYDRNYNLALALKQIPAIAFVPVQDVEAAFEKVTENICDLLDRTENGKF